MPGVSDRLKEYGTFLDAPARETGALQHGFGAVGQGQASLQTSRRQQRIDTQELERAAQILRGAGREYAAAQLELLPVQLEAAAAWSHLSEHAARAADLLLHAQLAATDLTADAVDYAVKLQTARMSYQYAEEIAQQLVTAFDAFYTAAARQMFTSAVRTAMSLPAVLTPPGAAAVAQNAGITVLAGVGLVGGAMADDHLRGRRATTGSVLRGGTGGQLQHTLDGARRLKQAERAAGVGLGRVRDFREAGTAEGRIERGRIGGAMARINAAGAADRRLDARYGEQDEVSTGHVDVQVVTRPDGTRAYTVSVPGSDFDNLLSTREPNGGFTTLDVASASGEDPLAQSPVLMQMVDRALREAGAGPGDEVLLTGFSQGGMTAQALAANREFTGRWRVAGVLSVGAPTSAYGGIPEQIPVLSVEDVNDPVPALLGEDSRPVNAQTQEVHVNMGAAEYGDGLFGTHNGAGYQSMAPQVEEQLQRTAEGREYLQMMDRMMPEGAAVQTRTYEATAEYYNADPADTRAPVSPANPATIERAAQTVEQGREVLRSAGRVGAQYLERLAQDGLPQVHLPEPCPAPQPPDGLDPPGALRLPGAQRIPGLHPLPGPVTQ